MTRRKPGPLTVRDAALWQKVTESLTPLEDRPAPAPMADLPKRHSSEVSSNPLPAEWYVGVGNDSNVPRSEMDRKSRRKITRGQTPVDQVLDLHGLTQEQAYPRLKRQIELAVQHGNRCVLVITGKGGKRFSQTSGSAAYRTRSDFDQHGGVLKSVVPIWLSSPEIAPFIRSYAPANQSDGGDGALYVMLRRADRVGGRSP